MRALKVHFIGIGGTGMGALAGLLVSAGHEVRGSDAKVYPPMSTQLEAAGIPVMLGFRDENLDWQPDVVVVGNVCSKDHVEVVAAQARDLPLESFPGLLAKTLLAEREPWVVAGTHGKTTTASMLAWLLCYAGSDPSFLIGGVPMNLQRGYRLGGGPMFVVEGDEYDTAFFDKQSKFLHYGPKRGILTGVEFDHADIFADLAEVRAAFTAFVGTMKPEGELLVHLEDAEAMGIAASAPCAVSTYRVLPASGEDVASADFCARMIEHGSPRRTLFEVFERGESLGEFSTQLVGRHNVGNIVAAIGLARRSGIDPNVLRRGVRRFRGIRRRQELVGIAQGVRVIEDFAHHPTACALTVTAMRKRYPHQALHVCFEPRSASSRREVFLEAYAGAFDAASTVHIGPLYRPEKVPEGQRLDPEALASAITTRGVEAHAYPSPDALLEVLVERVAPGDSVLVLSCGSFDGLPTRLLFALGDPVTLATAEDMPAVNTLLQSYGLPEIVPSLDVETLVLRTQEDAIVGSVSLQVEDDCAFLFGLAVRPDRRGEGLGWVLGDFVMRRARTLGAKTVYLVTSTAADFFGSKLGFRQLQLEAVDPRVLESENFLAATRLDNAVCMVFELPEEGALSAPIG